MYPVGEKDFVLNRTCYWYDKCFLMRMKNLHPYKCYKYFRSISVSIVVNLFLRETACSGSDYNCLQSLAFFEGFQAWHVQIDFD